MEHNSKLKNTLREERSLPSELGWEQMQKGIFEQMAQPEQKRRGLFFWLYWKKMLGAALLVLNFSVMAYLLYLVQKKEQIGAFPIPIEYQTTTTNNDNEEQVTTKLEEYNLTTAKKEQITTPISVNRPTATQPTIDSKNVLNYSLKKSPDRKIVLYNNMEQRISTDNPKSVETNSILSEEIASIRQANAFGRLTSATDLLEQQIPVIDHTIAKLKIERAAFQPYYILEIGGGTNHWNSNYNTALTEQNARAESETELWGYQVAANAKYYFKPNLYATTGLEFQQLNYRFNYENTRIDQVEARSTLIGIVINSISGDSTFIRQNVMLEVEEKRKVQHYNRHQVLTIPLCLGYEWRRNKLALGGSIGGVFSIQSFSKGKTLINSEIRTYDRNDPIYRKRFGMGLSANLQLNYVLTRDIYVGGNIGYTNWLTNWSAEEAVKLRPNIGQFSVVLGKRF